MNRKCFLALPLLLAAPFASAQTVVSDVQTHTQLTQMYATQLSQYQTELQILQQLQTLNQHLSGTTASVTPAERDAMRAQIAKTAVAIEAAQVEASKLNSTASVAAQGK